MTSVGLMSLLEGIAVRPLGAGDAVVSSVAYRSDKAVHGTAFFCIPGLAHDGHDFARDAEKRGATAIVVQHEVPGVAVPQFVVTDTRAALALAASALFGHPSAGFDVVGITGTNGKTTTTYLLDAILKADGRVTGVVGTVETRIGDRRLPSGRTTPESSDLQALLAEMRDQGVTGLSMEVSSHAIDLRRVDGVRFAAVAFTNLTQDHLDYHHTLEEYFSVKKRLFTEFDAGALVVNIDDLHGAEMADGLDGVISVGRALSADVSARHEVLSADGARFDLAVGERSIAVQLPLAGAFNVSNALVAAGCAHALGIELETIAAGLASAPQVPGRLERVDCGQDFSVVVDYAHTPDSLEKASAAVRAVTPGRVIVVFGCGGDRDPEKRPLMGAAAGRSADYVIVTSDNPRSEDPVSIILQVEDGVRSVHADYEVQVDRRHAIARAVAMARPGDCVLIAGKGHEDYQIFAERTIHFDDREVAREELRARC